MSYPAVAKSETQSETKEVAGSIDAYRYGVKWRAVDSPSAKYWNDRISDTILVFYVRWFMCARPAREKIGRDTGVIFISA